MALGRRCRNSEAKNGGESEFIALRAVRATRGLGRKRVGISKEVKESCYSEFRSPLKRQCSEKFDLETEFSPLEALPQELLIKVLCGVEHVDLKQLVLVSKPVLDAAMVAKRSHFEYSTPRKVNAFKNPIDMEESGEELEVPNAPRQTRRCRRRISLETKKNLTVSLFQSDGFRFDNQSMKIVAMKRLKTASSPLSKFQLSIVLYHIFTFPCLTSSNLSITICKFQHMPSSEFHTLDIKESGIFKTLFSEGKKHNSL